MTDQAPLNIAPLPVKLRLEDYLLLDEAGAFDAYRKTELIEGEVFFMNAQHRPHARTKSRLHLLLAHALDGTGLEPIVEGSIAVPPRNAPEPDIVVTSEAEGTGLIPLKSVRLIVEVSDATLRNDLNVKSAVYARHNVPEYWVVDIEARIVHQMWRPKDAAYAERREVTFGNIVDSATIEGLSIDTAPLN